MAQTTRRGILLAGGANSRLLPATRAVPKSLLPVYDRPLVYYPLSLLFAAGVRDILLIAAPGCAAAHRKLLGDGGVFGAHIAYTEQQQPRGIADAFIIGESFIANAPSALVLADNIFAGGGAAQIVRAASCGSGAQILARQVPDPQRFGVITMDDKGNPVSLEEKPEKPKSDWAITGCYFYDTEVCAIAKNLGPSQRGELEITDINAEYLRRGLLQVSYLSADTIWFDAGTATSLLTAANVLRDTKDADGLGSPEMTAYKQGWITKESLQKIADNHNPAPYAKALQL